ncbi:MAG: hypothetical protein ACI9HK_003344 [Pirellulaceae bacterium]|jgi:hypothetical protein
MSEQQNIDDILRNWEFDPESVTVRMCEGEDGRELIQMRVDMGVLQIETTNRPDGLKPHGKDTYLNHLAQSESEDPDFEMDEQHCSEADREFVQFYHRRICWLALKEYPRAVRDADHTLGLMDFCTNHSSDEEWTTTFEQYRPFVLFHRTQAASLACLENELDAEAAIEELNKGLDQMHRIFIRYEAEHLFDEDELVVRLSEFREMLRDEYDVGKTLQEKLSEAIAKEEYELAAQLRDELANRNRTSS